MKTRIKYLLDREKVTSAQFANEIGIAASSLHHIISGRNNPSLEVIQKILDRFPQINAEWLISGKGNTFKALVQGELFDFPEAEQKDDTHEISLINKPKTQPESSISEEKQENTIDKSMVQGQQKKMVSKIIVLYEDGTFDIHIKN